MNKLFCSKGLSRFALLIAIIFSINVLGNGATKISIAGPAGSINFGHSITPLANGNIVITDPSYNIPGGPIFVGAVYLYNGVNGQLISKIVGSKIQDHVGGGGITALANGNFVVSSPSWDNEAISDAGAVTFCSGTTGCGGAISSSNSLIGTKVQDYVGNSGVAALKNSNYVVSSVQWNNNEIKTAGAVTFCNGETGCNGPVSSSNSLVGTHTEDFAGSSAYLRTVVDVLPNNNYVVSSPAWNNSRGAVTFCSGTTGCQGAVSDTNSLIGSTADDNVGGGIAASRELTILANGNFVIRSPLWNKGTLANVGAVTLCSGMSGCQGTVSPENSLVGSAAGDIVGSDFVIALTNSNYVVMSANWNRGRGAATWVNGVTGISGEVSVANSLVGDAAGDAVGQFGGKALKNGNYVVQSPAWGNQRGAVTWGNGTTGSKGVVSEANSLIGTFRDSIHKDRVGDRNVIALSNGNYVVASELWNKKRGAATFANGDTGIVGEVSPLNSLVGTELEDFVGVNTIALTKGNYVVMSPGWNNGAIMNVGAATFCNDVVGCTGTISSVNSLIGSNTNDSIGNGYTHLALRNGNYVIVSWSWNENRGAVTWGNGETGVVGVVSASNSLVGSNPQDRVGQERLTELPNSNYVVNTLGWNSRGAVTWGSGETGVSGVISATNSLIGSRPGEGVGGDNNRGDGPGIVPLQNNSYIIRNSYWNNGINGYHEGAITLSKGTEPLTGFISPDNSLFGYYSQGGTRLVFAYDYVNRQMIVNSPDRNICTIFRYVTSKAAFDFDGDVKSDISIYRNGMWWYAASSAGGQHRAIQYGEPTDKLVPADYDGDGRTDTAVFRNGYWHIIKSSDTYYTGVQFGFPTDIAQPGDYDGDGKADVAVYRPSDGYWYILQSRDGFRAVKWGAPEDKPVATDFDGDGKTDVAVFRPSDGNWYLLKSRDGFAAQQWGAANDKPIVGDYDGDGKSDYAVFRPSNGTWYVLGSQFGFKSQQWGMNTDKPVPADYDGDGKTDHAVFRDGTWYQMNSSTGFKSISFGYSTDKPVPNSFVQ